MSPPKGRAAVRYRQALRPHRIPPHCRRTARIRQCRGLHGPPFNDAPADLPTALDATYQALLRPNGGVVPGNDPDFDWGNDTWTPSTSFFALASAGLGEAGKAQATLDWVLSKRNHLGELPELVDGNGAPASTVALAWTGSLLILTLIQLQTHTLKTPPQAA